MANELGAAFTWIYSRLADAAAVTAIIGDPPRAFPDLAPSDQPYPLAIYSLNAGTDVEAAGADRRVLSRLRITVKALTEDERDPAAALQLAAALDAALASGSDTLTLDGTSYQVLGCSREVPLNFLERDGEKTYHHAGGVYRLLIHALP